MNSCSSSDNYVPTPNPVQVSPVVFNLEDMPYDNLSDYNFFEGDIKQLNPVYGVLPYDLNSTLFSDYAKKKRFVWMPENVKASYVNDYTTLDFPTGAVLIKNFYYDNVQPNNSSKIIETRLMYKKEDGWDFANYLWNEDQTEATFTNQGHSVDLEWIRQGETKSTTYRVPSRGECFTCHNKFDVPGPIGPKPQNLNRDLTYEDGSANQLSKWVDFGYLEVDYPNNIVSTVNYNDTSKSLELRARSYVDINCAHCHFPQGYCNYRPMLFEFHLTEDLTNMGVCVEPEIEIENSGLTNIVTPTNFTRSAIHFRMSSTEEAYRMPFIGRTIVHEEGVALMEQWINSLTQTCN
ncbi:hypothetical protein [Lacinutrix salivirga]